MKKKDLIVKMPIGSLIKEHKKLLPVLKTGKGRKKEYKEQKQELNKYEQKIK